MAEAEHEAAEALVGVDPDHVPEDRAPADLHERLRDRLRVPRAAACRGLRTGSRLARPPPERYPRRAGRATAVEQPAVRGAELEQRVPRPEDHAQGAVHVVAAPDHGGVAAVQHVAPAAAGAHDVLREPALGPVSLEVVVVSREDDPARGPRAGSTAGSDPARRRRPPRCSAGGARTRCGSRPAPRAADSSQAT